MNLTDEQLREETGAVWRKKQVQWLRANGWAFTVDCHGRPLVAVEFWRIKKGLAPSAQNDEQWEPDFSQLEA